MACEKTCRLISGADAYGEEFIPIVWESFQIGQLALGMQINLQNGQLALGMGCKSTFKRDPLELCREEQLSTFACANPYMNTVSKYAGENVKMRTGG